jgi:hypothetical protein
VGVATNHCRPYTDQRRYRRDASDSPLLRPPPELRNRIYNYVLGSYLVFLVPRNDFKWFANARCGPRSKDFKAIVGLPTPQGMNAVAVPDKGCILALLCRQICIEARMLPFAVNEIRCNHTQRFGLKTTIFTRKPSPVSVTTARSSGSFRIR